MKYYAIRRKKDKKLVSGSDFRYYPPHCIMADEYRPPLLIPAVKYCFLTTEMLRRKINLKRYEIITVEINEVQL